MQRPLHRQVMVALHKPQRLVGLHQMRVGMSFSRGTTVSVDREPRITRLVE